MEIANYWFAFVRKEEIQGAETQIPRITPRMLSKELKDLEINGIVKRTVHDTIPVTVEYELTESGRSLNSVLDAMIEWGLDHRKMSIAPEKAA